MMKESMRVAMVGPFGFRPKKTMRARAFRLAQALVAQGQQVAIFMPPWHTPDEADRTWSEDGVRLRYVALGGGPVAIIGRLCREVSAWQPDVVWLFKPKAYSALVGEWFWQTARQRLRLVMDSDDWEGWGGWNEREPYPRPLKHFFAWQERRGMAHCHALTVASRALETLAWGQGIPPQQVHYLPNGSGLTLPDPPLVVGADRPTLLLYSRFFEFDNTRLIAILERVRQPVPQVRLRVVGAALTAEEGAEFGRLLTRHALDGMVEALGWLPEEEVPAALASADVGLYLMDDTLINRTKCPVKLADMAAIGLPIAGEAVGQVAEYVQDGRTGLLRPSGDVDGVAADVVALLESAEMRTRFGTAARQHMAQFRQERLAQLALVALRS
jgi:glycosyltransferase involved in cell wall biosynthesis